MFVGPKGRSSAGSVDTSISRRRSRRTNGRRAPFVRYTFLSVFVWELGRQLLLSVVADPGARLLLSSLTDTVALLWI